MCSVFYVVLQIYAIWMELDRSYIIENGKQIARTENSASKVVTHVVF
jgi:hypothetical protein